MRGVAFSTLLLCASIAAQADGPAGTVRTIDGRSFTGALTVGADEDVTVTSGGESVTLELAEVAGFTAAQPVKTPSTPPHRVWLRSGQEFAANEVYGIPAADGKPARLAAELAVGVTLELPISTLRAIRQAGKGRDLEPPSFDAELQDPPDNNDLLYVQKDGKVHRFQITVTGMQREVLDFDLRGRPHDYALDGIVGVVFGNNTGFAADPQPPPRVEIDFDTGDRLEGRLLGLGRQVRLRLDEGCEVAVPSGRIVRFAVASDRLRWLSDLEPEVEQTAAFDRVWPWTVDRSVAGPGFVLGGETFMRGLGMVPRTRLTYDLDGKYDVFEAVIGIDDRGGPQAHALFRVLVDGEPVYESGPKTRGQPGEHVRVELNKCRQLAIEVDFGKNYDLGDYCAFADARVLIQK